MAGSLIPARCSCLSAATLSFMLSVPVAAGTAAQPRECPVNLVAGPARVLAHPMVAGAVRPFAKGRVTLIASNALAGPFTGRLDVAGGRCFLLVGPDDPTGLFDFFVTAIVFTPLDRGRSNGIVILYDKVQRSPEHDTYPGALAYRVDEDGAARVPGLEQQVEDARSAAQVRRLLKPIPHLPVSRR